MQSLNATSRPVLISLADVSSVRVPLAVDSSVIYHTVLPELAFAASLMVALLSVIRLILVNWMDKCSTRSLSVLFSKKVQHSTVSCTLADDKPSQSPVVARNIEQANLLSSLVATTSRVSPTRANPHAPRVHSKLALDAGLVFDSTTEPARPPSPPRFLGRATSPKSLARSLAEKSVKREIASCAGHPLAPKPRVVVLAAPTPRLSQGPTRLTLLAPPPLSLASHPFAAPTVAGCEAPRLVMPSIQLTASTGPVHPFCAPLAVDTRPKPPMPSLTISC